MSALGRTPDVFVASTATANGVALYARSTADFSRLKRTRKVVKI